MDKLLRRFFEAVSLCTGAQAIKPRLADAWVQHLDAIDPGKLPPGLRVKFRQLRTAMYREQPMPGEHVARASVRKMSQKQAAEHTRTIAAIYSELTRIQFENQSPVTQPASQGTTASDSDYDAGNETLLN